MMAKARGWLRSPGERMEVERGPKAESGAWTLGVQEVIGLAQGAEKEQPAWKEETSRVRFWKLERVCQALCGALSGKSPHQLLPSAL